MNPDARIPGFPAPGASFEAPLEMLVACHGRIERQCAILLRLVTHLAAHGADVQAQTAAANVLRYFDTAALQHHADEEADLFPALLESMAGSDAVCIREITERLSGEHRLLEAAWRRLREPLEKIAGGEVTALDAAQVESFTRAYADHLAFEEAELLPMAARLLGDAEIEAIGRAMRERRGIGAA
ncbi:MAG TPA: hemerythrin domain-containing protein [Burkholderiales bacterium]|jgi:hemerythrin-like domain-containing protein|nr:hemerythrin domain-containing protein [Burkholderiales bacterium]